METPWYAEESLWENIFPLMDRIPRSKLVEIQNEMIHNKQCFVDDNGFWFNPKVLKKMILTEIEAEKKKNPPPKIIHFPRN